MLKAISLYLMMILYVAAGFNHFIHPGMYYRILPEYLPLHGWIVVSSGVAEIVLGLLLLPRQTRFYAAWAIIIMLFLFIPAHIYAIQKPPCLNPELCSPKWLTWLRLIPGQPLLMAWAWWHTKDTYKKSASV